ncbi:MAG: hypothetical protein J6M60_00515 [Clostridia bacterium]|nr:hypothetical protein [Clostridia bacterium]
MGLFNEKNIEKLNKAGVHAELDKDYTDKEKEEMNFELSEFIYSHSTKNNDIPNLLSEYADELNKLNQ